MKPVENRTTNDKTPLMLGERHPITVFVQDTGAYAMTFELEPEEIEVVRDEKTGFLVSVLVVPATDRKTEDGFPFPAYLDVYIAPDKRDEW